MFWERMGLGSSVEQAFQYIETYGSSQTRKSFFGENALFDYGGEDDNITLYGNGIIDQIELGY